MELKLIEKTKDSVKIEVIGESDTLLNLLRKRLLEHKSVNYANYSAKHPFLDNPVLFIKVDEGDPLKILAEVSSKIIDEFNDCKKLFEVELNRLEEVGRECKKNNGK